MTAPTSTPILYVDDDESNRVVFRHSFAAQFTIATANNADQALEYLHAHPVGVIITDQRMPGRSGNALLEQVRHEFPEIVRVVLTAYSDLDPILRAVNAGLVARYIVKPWDHAELTEVLLWACEAYAAGQMHTKLHERLLKNERLAMLGRLSTALCHDLGQPLAALAMLTQRTLDITGSEGELRRVAAACRDPVAGAAVIELADKLVHLSQRIHEASELLAGMIRGVPRLLADNPGDDPRGVPVAAIQQACSLVASNSDHPPQVDYVGPSELPKVVISAAELVQTLLNLLTNAVQALEGQQQPLPTVRLEARLDGSFVEFIITDNGPGMPQDVVQRATKTHFTTRQSGSGLGLSQCLRIVEGNGGRFAIESEMGAGTRVRFSLPIVQQHP